MIVDSLRYWVEEMHVDGFRFDLASILSRDESGAPLGNPPVLWDIETDPSLAGVEADRRGLGRRRAVPGRQLHRRSLEGMERPVPRRRAQLRARRPGHGPRRSHRGSWRAPTSTATRSARPSRASTSSPATTASPSTTWSPTTTSTTRRTARTTATAHNDNRSWNCGAEGPSDDPAIEALRTRQAKNLLAVTLLALGTPMLQMGDEMRRTQHGNNNAYCQDNEISWLDWRLLEQHRDLHRFVTAAHPLPPQSRPGAARGDHDPERAAAPRQHPLARREGGSARLGARVRARSRSRSRA